MLVGVEAGVVVPWPTEGDGAEPMTGEHKRQFTRAACALLYFGNGSVGRVHVDICPLSKNTLGRSR